MAKYRKNFKKIVWGYIEVEANSNAKAEQQWLDGYDDEIDNKSEYEFEDWVEVK